MALDLGDLYLIHATGDRNNIRTRAKTLEDNFGIKTQNIEEFRSQHGGTGLLKAIGVAAVTLVATAVLGAALVSGGIIGAGLAAGLVSGITAAAAFLTMASQNEKVMTGYSNYLDDVAAQARSDREHGMGHAHGHHPQRGHQITPEENALLNQRLAEDRAQNERMGLMASAGTAAGR